MGNDPWSQKMIDELLSRYKHQSGPEIAKYLGVTKRSIDNMKRRLKLYRYDAPWTEEQIRELVLRYPHEKNEIIAEAVGKTVNAVIGLSKRMKLKKTKEFTTAARPSCAIGTEVMSCGYLIKKVAINSGRKDWIQVHVIVWEKENGPVPDGHIVIFKDGNRSNFDISNLECISKRENLNRNSVHRLPKELAELCQLRGALNRQINKRAKNEQ